MEKPNSEKLDEVIDHVEKIRDLQSELASLRSELKSLARSLENIEEDALRMRCAQYAYWMLPEIAADDISYGLVGTKRNNKFMTLMGSVSVGIECENCREILPINSRTQMKAELDRARDNRARYAEGYKHLCKACEVEVYEKRHADYDQKLRKHDNEIHRLRALAYADYKQTDFWKAKHAEQYDWNKRTKGMEGKATCEICSVEQELSLYHKSADAVAREDFNNTLLICKECAQLLGQEGKIYRG